MAQRSACSLRGFTDLPPESSKKSARQVATFGLYAGINGGTDYSGRNVTETTICHDMLKLRPRSPAWGLPKQGLSLSVSLFVFVEGPYHRLFRPVRPKIPSKNALF
jgi:hypothetical protein